MKNLIVAVSMFMAMAANAAQIDDSGWRSGPSDAWFVNWDKALAEARKTNRPIFVLNTGSDWCYWCKKLKEDVLEKTEFKEFAAKNLVLVYLDSPNRNPLGKEQRRHNRQIVKTLAFGGGVPNVGVFTAKGKKLGTIGGGGQTVDVYLESLKSVLKEKGQYFGDDDARTLFTDGYGKLAEEIAAARAKLPPATKNDFKARLTGVAIVDDSQRQDDYGKADFKPPETPLDVPFGKKALFRLEYDFPEGYGARVGASPDLPADERKNAGYLGIFLSGFCRAKGTTYSCLCLLENGTSCTLKSIRIRIMGVDPELDDHPYGFTTAGSVKAHLNFKAKDDSPAEKEEPVEPYVSRSKLHAAYRSKDRNKVYVEVCHQHTYDTFATPPFTLDRLREVIAARADILFLTPARSKDGVLFSAEDRELADISNGKGRTGDYTAAQLKRLKVKHRDRLASKGFATLEDMLKMGKGKILFSISQAYDYAKELEALLNRLDAWESVIVEGWDISVAREKYGDRIWRKIRSGELQIMVGDSSFGKWKSIAPECSVWGWHLDLEEKGLKGIDQRINVGFVYGPGDAGRTDDEAGWEKALKEGVTVFRTNRPKELGNFLKKRRRR